jgi:integrase
LRWVDTHLDAGSIEVLNQIVQYGWETAQATPKTDASAATVALDEETVWVLGEQRVAQAKERAAAGESWVESGLVFTELDRSPLHPADVTERFHLLVVQAMLRHASITTTSDLYTEVLPELSRDAARKVALIIPRWSSRRLGRVSGAQETIVDGGDSPATTAKCEVNGDVDLACEGAPPGT